MFGRCWFVGSKIGVPAARTVALLAAGKETASLAVHTDIHAGKVKDLFSFEAIGLLELGRVPARFDLRVIQSLFAWRSYSSAFNTNATR